MTDFLTKLKNGGGLSLVREVSGQETRFLCYTSFSDSESLWGISASDGRRVWSVSLSESEVEKLAKKWQLSETAFIRAVSTCVASGELDLLPGGSQLSLCLKIAPETVELSLHVLSDPTSQLCSLIFTLWSKLQTAQSQLEECRQQLEDARSDKQHDVPLVDVSRGSKAGVSRAKRPAGASLVNPSLKRRKAVKGVVFGDNE